MYAIHSGLVRSPAGAGQMDGIAPSKEDALAASQAVAGEVVPRSRPFSRLATMTAIILILVVIIGMGILLTKQQAALAIGTSQPTPTAASHWHILASLPTARTGLAITTFENQVYAIGGESATGMTGTVDRYDPATDAWVTVSQMPVPVTDVNAAVIGGKIYIPGGRLPSGKMTNALEIYSPRQDSWENGSNLPMPMSAYAMAAFEGRLYLFGGWDGIKYLNSVYMYDPGQDQWAAITSMQGARGYASAAVAGDKIYVIGGYDGKQALKINDAYSPYPDDSKKPWSQAAPMPEGRYAFGMASIADAIYVLGGKSDNKGLLSTIFYSFQSDKWQEYEMPPMSLGNDVRLTPLGQYLYALGGGTNNGTSGYNLSYQAIFTIMLPIVP